MRKTSEELKESIMTVKDVLRESSDKEDLDYLKYLLRKERVANLDREEIYELSDLLRKFPDFDPYSLEEEDEEEEDDLDLAEDDLQGGQWYESKSKEPLKSLRERSHRIVFGNGVEGYAEPGEDVMLFYRGNPCGFKVGQKVYLDKNCPEEVYEVFPDYVTTSHSFKGDIDNTRRDLSRGYMSFGEALSKVHLGEWSTEDFLESLNKGLIE